MDVWIYVVTNLAAFGLGAFMLAKRSPAMAIFPLFGALLGIFVFLGLGSDGDLTQTAGAVVNVNPVAVQSVLVSGSIASFSWELVLLIPLFVVLGDFVLVIARGLGKL